MQLRRSPPVCYLRPESTVRDMRRDISAGHAGNTLRIFPNPVINVEEARPCASGPS